MLPPPRPPPYCRPLDPSRSFLPSLFLPLIVERGSVDLGSCWIYLHRNGHGRRARITDRQDAAAAVLQGTQTFFTATAQRTRNQRSGSNITEHGAPIFQLWSLTSKPPRERECGTFSATGASPIISRWDKLIWTTSFLLCFGTVLLALLCCWLCYSFMLILSMIFGSKELLSDYWKKRLGN